MKLKVLKCPECQAPLEIGPDVNQVQCIFCRAAIQVERAKPPAPVQGVVQVPARTVYVHDGGRSRGGCAVFAVLALIALIAVGAALGPQFFKKLSSKVGGGVPATCGINEQLTIEGVTFDGPGPLVTANVNCKLTIKDCTLKSDVIVRSSGIGNADVNIINSKLEASKTAIEVGLNGKVHITNKSDVHGAIAIAGGVNTEVTVDDSTVRGEEAAIRIGFSPKVRATKSEIIARDKALDLSLNGSVTLKDTTVKADLVAIAGTMSLEVRADGSTISAENAITGDMSVAVRLERKSKVSATEVAIRGDTSTEITIDDSTVESEDTAIKAGSVTTIKLMRDARVRGRDVGIDVDSSYTLEMNGATLETEGTAVFARGSGRVTAKRSTIRAGKSAFETSDKPTLDLVDTTVTGRQVFNVPSNATPSRPPPPPGGKPKLPSTSAKPAASASASASASAATKPPPFDAKVAQAALDVAAARASASCKSPTGKPMKPFVYPGFTPDGKNSNPRVQSPKEVLGTPAAACIEGVMREVTVPAFDAATLPGGMGRSIDLR